MRILLCLAFFYPLALGTTGCNKPSAATSRSSAPAPLSVDPPSLDLGVVTFGNHTSGIYTLRNTTSKPLQISRIGPFSCQCISAILKLPTRSNEQSEIRLDGKRLHLILAPNEVAKIYFTLDTSRYRQPTSRKVGSIPIVFQNYPGMILEWGADIWTPFAVEPWIINLKEVGVRERASGTALVVAHDSTQFELEVDLVDEDGWSVKSRSVSLPQQPARYELTFTAPEVLPEGPFQKQFVFRTDLPGAPPVRIAVQGFALPDLGFSPTRLVFDPTRNRLEADLQIIQRAADADLASLDLSRLAAQKVQIVSRKPLKPGGVLLRLRYLGSAKEKATNFSLQIPTNDPSTPLLEIPVLVMPLQKEPQD